MANTPGEPLASGRAADVFDQGDGTVLRRYRDPAARAEPEARVMTWVAEQGYPVPAVSAVDGPDLVMERVAGPTLLEDLEARPWMARRHAQLLAELQRRLNALVAPGWFPTRAGVTDGAAVLHLDLHPMNVILSPDGPVVIDWTNASRGGVGFDAAITVVLMSAYEVTGRRDRLARDFFVALFRRARGRTLVRESLTDAARYRLDDPNVTPGERDAIMRMIG